MNTLSEERRVFHVPMMYHPSHDVLDLTEAEGWYERMIWNAECFARLADRQAPAAPRLGLPAKLFDIHTLAMFSWTPSTRRVM